MAITAEGLAPTPAIDAAAGWCGTAAAQAPTAPAAARQYLDAFDANDKGDVIHSGFGAPRRAQRAGPAAPALVITKPKNPTAAPAGR